MPHPLYRLGRPTCAKIYQESEPRHNAVLS